jgi:hypothetical protein
MRRWHNEVPLMHKRWKMEMDKHGYDWRCPPTDPDACHCAKGIGSMRNKKPLDCGNPMCAICHWEKFYLPKARQERKRKAILDQLS